MLGDVRIFLKTLCVFSLFNYTARSLQINGADCSLQINQLQSAIETALGLGAGPVT